MLKELRPSFERLERQKAALLADLASVTPPQLSFRPAAESWSILDVLDHLVRVEQGMILAVRDRLPDGAPVSMKDRVGALAVNLVMRSPMKVKVPNGAASVLPQPSATLAETETRWQDVRTEMAGLLADFPLPRLSRGFFKHPVSGWMTIVQALGFVSAHMSHHKYQLNRLNRKS